MNHIEGIKSLLGGYLNYKYNGKELQESGMYETAPNFIVLGHELIHVKDHFNGTLNKTEAEHSYSDLKGIRLIETHPKSEFRASGFPGFVGKDGYSEDKTRTGTKIKSII